MQLVNKIIIIMCVSSFVLILSLRFSSILVKRNKMGKNGLRGHFHKLHIHKINVQLKKYKVRFRKISKQLYKQSGHEALPLALVINAMSLTVGRNME